MTVFIHSLISGEVTNSMETPSIHDAPELTWQKNKATTAAADAQFPTDDVADQAAGAPRALDGPMEDAGRRQRLNLRVTVGLGWGRRRPRRAALKHEQHQQP